MGQKPSTSNLSQNFLLPELSFLKQLSHPAYGEIKIYQNPNSHDFYALRSILKDSKSFDCSLPPKLQQYQAINSSETLVKLIKSECLEHKDLCSNFNRINMLFEFYPKSLASEYQIRRQNRESFVELDLIHIFIALISALHALKSQNIVYSDLIPNHILLSRTGLAKLTPIDDLTGFTRYNKLLFGSRDGFYVSPEQLRAFGDKVDSKEFINDHEKENVFSVGMILLEGMTLAEVREYYDLGTSSVKFDVIEKVLIESKASDSFKLLLRRMLDPEAENRPSYEELLGEVTNFKDNFLGIKLHCYSVKETSEINIVHEQHEQNISQNMENQRKISAFNEENQEGPPPQGDNFGFSNYVAPEERKGGTPLLNLQEIGLNPVVSLKEMNLPLNQRELVDIAWFRSHMEQLVNEGLSISEEIQQKYHVLTNKKPVFPEDFDQNTIQSSYFLKRESNSPKNSSIVLKKVDSSTNMANDYHYFARGNTMMMSPLHNRRSMDLTENKTSGVHNMIKNFDYNLTGTPSSGQKRLERKKTTKLRSMNISPKKGVTSSSGKNDKKYYTPKRDPTEKMKLKESGSTKKPSVFKDRPVTPNYENLYWEALRKKF